MNKTTTKYKTPKRIDLDLGVARGKTRTENGARLLDITISTDTPDTWKSMWSDTTYRETLIHTKEAIDLSRFEAEQPPSPFCKDHQHRVDAVIGHIDHTSCQIVKENGMHKLIATVRLDTSEEVSRLMDKVDNGHLGAISVGAMVKEQTFERIDDETVIIEITEWQPVEASLVAIPADNNCHVRSIAKQLGFESDEPPPNESEKNNTPTLDKAKNKSNNAKQADSKTKQGTGSSQQDRGANSMNKIIKALKERIAKQAAGDETLKAKLNDLLLSLSGETYDDSEGKEGDGLKAAYSEKSAEIIDEHTAAVLKEAKEDAERILTNAKTEAEKAAAAAKVDDAAAEDSDETETKTKSQALMINTGKAVYSFTKALDEWGAKNDSSKLTGLEKEFHDEQANARADKSKRQVKGLLMPREFLALKALQGYAANPDYAPGAQHVIRMLMENQEIFKRAQDVTASTGLVHDRLDPTLFIAALRPIGGILNWGIRVLENLSDELLLPKQTSVTSAHWIDSDDIDIDPAETSATFGDVDLEFHSLAAYTKITRKATKLSHPAVDQLIAMDIIRTFAIGITNAALFADGTGGAPTGILNTTGVVSANVDSSRVSTYTEDGANKKRIAPNRDEIIDLQTAMAVDDALALAAPRWIANPMVAGNLRKTKVDDGSGMFLLNKVAGIDPMGNPMGVPMLDFSPFSTYTPMAQDKLLFGAFSQLTMGFFGPAFEVRTDQVTNFGTINRMICDMGLAITQNKAFGVLKAA